MIFANDIFRKTKVRTKPILLILLMNVREAIKSRELIIIALCMVLSSWSLFGRSKADSTRKWVGTWNTARKSECHETAIPIGERQPGLFLGAPERFVESHPKVGVSGMHGIQHSFWIFRGDTEKHTRGTFGLSPALFPVSKCRWTDPEQLCELLLSESQMSPDCRYVWVLNAE